MTCTGAFATPEDFTKQWFYDFDNSTEVELQPVLENSAGRIHAAMAAQGMCDCTLAEWAENYLRELNCVAAAVMFNLPCVRLSTEQRQQFWDYLNDQLEKIMQGQIELCAGETGRDAPAFGVAQYGLTPIGEAEIILNNIIKNS